MGNRLTDGEAQVGSLRILGGDAVDGIILATVSVDPANIATVTRGSIAVAVPGAKLGGFVIANPPSDLEAGLLFVGAYVSLADEVTIMLYNPTGGGVNGVAKNWNIMVVNEA